MNLGNCIVSLGALNSILMENGKDRKIAFGTRARLIRIRELLEKEAAFYENERIRLVKEFGDEVEKEGEKVVEVVDKEKIEKFYTELEVILKTDIDVTFKKLSKKELAAIEELEIEITDPQIVHFYEFIVAQDEQL